MTFPVVYEPAARDSGGPMPGARALMAACLALYPPATNLGIYNPRDQRGTNVTSLHAEGRAIDVGYPDVGGPSGRGHPVGQQLANDMVRYHAELGVQCVIYYRRIWSTTKPSWRAYSGTDPHTGHLHIELNRAAAAGLTSAEAIRILTPPTQGEPMATPDIEAAQRMLNSWLPGRQITTDGDWGPASTAALKEVLDYCERRIRELEAAARNQAPVASDADRKLAALKAALLEVVG